MFFWYHAGEQALIFPHTETGKPTGIKLKMVVSLGWNATHEALRAALPRFGEPGVRVEPELARKVGLAMRRGR